MFVRFTLRPRAIRDWLGVIRDNSGSVAITAAVAFPVLIGGIALGAEVGYWYVTDRKLQHAADIAAYSAAIRLSQKDADDKLEAVALHTASQSGFRPESGTIAVHTPPSSGPNVGDPEMVEVDLTRQVDRLFTKLFSDDEFVAIRARAVAKFAGGTVCVLALSPNGNSALKASGAATATFENCIVASNSTSNSSFHMQNANVTADCVFAGGGYQVTGGSSSLTLAKCKSVKENHDPIDDPYADVSFPTAPTTCVDPGTIENTTVTPMLVHSSGAKYARYCSLTVKGNVTFEPGLYFVDGAFTNNGNTSLSGSGVTFVLSGNVTLNGNIAMDLSAPTSGPYSGLVFFGDRDSTKESVKVSGDLSSSLQGAAYFPTGNMLFTGSSAVSSGCTQVIAYTIEFTGSSEIKSSCGTAGVEQIRVGKSLVQLVE
jgi:hypothetical protein